MTENLFILFCTTFQIRILLRFRRVTFSIVDYLYTTQHVKVFH